MALAIVIAKGCGLADGWGSIILSLAFVTLWSYMGNKVALLMQLKATLNFEVLYKLNEVF